jgi:hypothetical protein
MTLEDGLASERSSAAVVRSFLVIGLLIDVVAIGSGVAQHALLVRAASVGITKAEAASNDLRHGIIGGLQLLAFLITAICWIIWFRRAYGNLTLMGTRKSDYAPGWAIGCWFVPIVNLFRPYRLTKEVWLRSANRNALDSVKQLVTPGLVSIWWGINILSGLLGRMQLSWAARAKQIDELQGVTMLGIAADCLGIVSAVVAISLVLRIDRLQRAAGSPEPEPDRVTA